MSEILSAAAIQAHLENLEGWTLEEGVLIREDEPKDFRAALAWINRVGMLAEEHNHHPDFHLTRWNHVRLRLWSHDVGGLTERDFNLARNITKLALRR